MEDDVSRLEPRVARIEAQLNARIDKLDAKVESKLDTLGFGFLIALLSAALTLVGTVVGVLLSAAYAH